MGLKLKVFLVLMVSFFYFGWMLSFWGSYILLIIIILVWMREVLFNESFLCVLYCCELLCMKVKEFELRDKLNIMCL